MMSSRMPGEARLLGRPRPSLLFLYGLLATVLAIYSSEPRELAVLLALTGIPGLALGVLKYRWLVALAPLGIIGVASNALLLDNLGLIEDPGRTVYQVGPVRVSEYTINSTTVIAMRILTFAGAGLLLASIITPRDAIIYLHSDLRLPKGIAFSLAFALRLLPLVARDLGEILEARRMRGFRRIPLTPGDYASIIAPLLSVTLERAVWTGIAAELRGYRLRRARRIPWRPSPADAILVSAATIQLAVVAL